MKTCPKCANYSMEWDSRTKTDVCLTHSCNFFQKPEPIRLSEVWVLQQHQPYVSLMTWRNVAAFASLDEASPYLDFYGPGEARVVKLETRGKLAELIQVE